MSDLRLHSALPPEERVVLTADRVLNEDATTFIDGGAISIRNGRIAAVGSADALVDTAEQVLSFPGHSLLPGLINSHVHLTISHLDVERPSVAHQDTEVERTLAAAARLGRCLAAGITTVRDVGASDRGIFALRAAVERGEVLGSRVFAAGALLCATGGHAYRIGHEADGASGMRRAAREELKAGADFLKLMTDGGTSDRALDVAQPSLTDAEIEAVVSVAHRLGRRVTAHAIAPLTIAAAIRGGVDAIEHGYSLDAELATAMAQAQIAFVPTMSVHAAVLRQSEEALAEVWWLDHVRRGRQLSRNAVQAALTAGVAIAAGTDGGSPFNPHEDLVGELELLTQVGMSNLEAVAAATIHGATLLDASDEIGALRTGLAADVIAVPGDPEHDLAVLKRPTAVFMGGNLVFSASGVSNVAVH